MTTQALQKDTAPNGPEPTGSRVNGVFDLPSPGRIAGWAIDRADPEAAVEVEIFREGALLIRARADRHRPDLERGGVGTGRYGFSIEVDPPIAPEMAFTLSARAVTADGVSGALRPSGKAIRGDDPLRALIERTYDQTVSLRSEMGALRRSIGASQNAMDISEVEGVLERIELVQARLDGVAAATEPPADPSVGPGLRLAVGTALAISMLALALGLWSVFG